MAAEPVQDSGASMPAPKAASHAAGRRGEDPTHPERDAGGQDSELRAGLRDLRASQVGQRCFTFAQRLLTSFHAVSFVSGRPFDSQCPPLGDPIVF